MRKLSGNIFLLVFAIAACSILLVGSLAAAKAESTPPLPLSVTSPVETWNLGITVEGTPTYNAVIGRLVSNVGVFRSARATGAATIFPAPASTRTIQSASVYLLSRTGAYSGTATLSLVIYNYAGTLQHTVSAASIDLETVPSGEWATITLSSTPDDLVISPGEFLAFSYALDAAAGGDLDIRAFFEVSVR